MLCTVWLQWIVQGLVAHAAPTKAHGPAVGVAPRWRRCLPFYTSEGGTVIYHNPPLTACGPTDAFVSPTNLSGPDALCDAPGAYPVFWNVGGCSIYDPQERCNASTRDPMPVDVTKFGILGANWTQANIPTLQGSTNWQPSFRSLMPVVALNGSGLLLNGGVPQNANLTAFVEQLRSQVPLWIPAVQYTGLAVLDFEAWSTVWELNVEPGLAWHSQVYQNVSKQLVRARHPNWSEVQVEARAKEEFETAATAWFVTTLEVCKQIRPHAKWGWYGLPQGSSPIDYGQRQMPVFLAADAIYPSIYDFGDCSGTASEIKAQETYVRSLVAQSVSLSKAVFRAQPGRARAPPVYPFASEVCRASGPPILPREDLRASLVAPYAAGASGIVIWGMPAGDMAAAHINYTEYWAHVNAVTGPMAQAVSTDAERCAVESCSGNGRCLSLPNYDYVLGVRDPGCDCAVPWSGPQCSVHKCVDQNRGRVAYASCFGWDETDSTESLQLALSDTMISTLIVDVPPDPTVGWVVRPLFITRDNLTVIFEDGVLLHARKGHFQGVDGDQASLLTVYQARNISLIGRGNATLRMRRGDYLNASLGYVKHSEWRMGIKLIQVHMVRVHGLRVEETGGDGIYILGYSDIHISDCVLDRNFRQGISIINASNLLVERTTCSNTDGTPPMAGIDMEPDSHCMMFVNVTIRDSTFVGNSGFGWILSPSMLNGSSRDLSVVLENITVSGGLTRPAPDSAHPAWRPGMGLGITGILQDGTLRPGWGHGRTGGSVLISNSAVSGTWGSGLFITSKGTHAAKVTLSNVTFDTVQKESSPAHCPAPVSKSCPPPAGSYGVPIFVGGNSDSCFATGDIMFKACTIIDPLNRSFIELENVAQKCPNTRSGQWAISHIDGAFTVHNGYGCQYGAPANATDVNIDVDCIG